MNESLTIEKLRAAMPFRPLVRSPLDGWDGTVQENTVLTVSKSRSRTWKERLFTLPWCPWQRVTCWSEPDPNFYVMDVPALLSKQGHKIMVAHPITAAKLRAAAEKIL